MFVESLDLDGYVDEDEEEKKDYSAKDNCSQIENMENGLSEDDDSLL